MLKTIRLGALPLLVSLTIVAAWGASFNPAAAQTIPGQQVGIVVSGLGRVSGQASLAEVQILIGRDFYGVEQVAVSAEEVGTPVAGDSEPMGSPGFVSYAPPALTESDLAPVVEAIAGVGVAREQVQVFTPGTSSMFNGPGGPGGAQLRFTISDPTTEIMLSLATAVTTAAISIGANVQHIGVHYAGSDCMALEAEALALAVAEAETRAGLIAAALGVTLGPLTQAADSGLFGGLGLIGGTCAPATPEEYDQFGSGMLPAYDPSMPVEAVVLVQITLTYAFSTEPAA
jgi:Protein of unknown function (DUF541)